MSDRDNKDTKASRWSRFSKQASFWILITAVAFLMTQILNPNRSQSAPLDYHPDFLTQLDAGNVSEVTIIDGKKIDGKLRNPIQVPESSKPTTEFWTMLPV